MKTWVVSCGRGAEYRGAFNTLVEAMKFVAQNIVRPKGNNNFEWHCQMTSDGVNDYYYWQGPTRKQTRAEMDAVFDAGEMGKVGPRKRANIIDHWLKSGVVVDDEQYALERYEFPNGFVSGVQISTVERERQFLAKSDVAGNDNRARREAFERLIACKLGDF